MQPHHGAPQVSVSLTDAGAPFVVSRTATDGGPMRIVVVASGALAPGDEAWLDGADLVIAADGGADALDRLGRRPDRLVGDLDSADPALVERLAASGTTDRPPPGRQGGVGHRARGAGRGRPRARIGSTCSAPPAAIGSTTSWRTSCSSPTRPSPASSCACWSQGRPSARCAAVRRWRSAATPVISSRCCRSAAMRAGSPPAACAGRSTARPWRWARRAACRTRSSRRAHRSVSATGCSSSSKPRQLESIA